MEDDFDYDELKAKFNKLNHSAAQSGGKKRVSKKSSKTKKAAVKKTKSKKSKSGSKSRKLSRSKVTKTKSKSGSKSRKSKSGSKSKKSKSRSKSLRRADGKKPKSENRVAYDNFIKHIGDTIGIKGMVAFKLGSHYKSKVTAAHPNETSSVKIFKLAQEFFDADSKDTKMKLVDKIKNEGESNRAAKKNSKQNKPTNFSDTSN